MGTGARLTSTWTVLVTDMVGSTALRTRLGEATYAGLRVEHDRIVVGAVGRHGAAVTKHTGDGVLAGFPSTASAVRAIVDIERAIARRNASTQEPFGLRAGLAVGDVAHTADDIDGIAAILATRLCAAATEAEVLCTVAVRDVVANDTDLHFEPPRPYSLKGIVEPVLACRLAWASPDDRLPTFSVLGPVRAEVAGRDVRIGGPKERLVLAVLLARAGAIVGVDEIVEALWADGPPRSAARSVHAYVARLRGALEPGPTGSRRTVIVTDGSGYRLECTDDHLDAGRFETLLARARAELGHNDPAASGLARQALDLWRGPAFADALDARTCSAAASALEELRRQAVEVWADAELGRGASNELVPALEQAVEDEPLRERRWAHLMLALYRAGRQTDALRAFQRARETLATEVGVEPGPELRALEAGILEHDVSLLAVTSRTDRPAGLHGRLPLDLDASGALFVGRGRELAQVREAWDRARAGHGTFVSVLGVEGAGKTRLAAELGAIAHRDGGVVLYGRCDHAHRGVRNLLDLAARSGGVSLAQIESCAAAAGAAAVVDGLGSLAGGRPVLVVLDDLHLADAEALESIAELASWCAAATILLVGMFRVDASVADADVADGSRVVLGPLDRGAVAEICRSYTDAGWSGEDVSDLERRSRGIPLLVHEHAAERAERRTRRWLGEAAGAVAAIRSRLSGVEGDVADGVSGLQLVLAQRNRHLGLRSLEHEPALAVRCPYRGLARYEAADAAEFFGRERLVAELVARLAGEQVLAVVGPSGCGKSSVVRAGLLPALAAGVLPGSEAWQAVVCCPGSDPTAALAEAIASHDAGRRLLVVVDQFEELFDMCTDDATRSAFVDGLLDLLDRDDAPILVMTVRADAFGRCAGFDRLGARLDGRDVLVGTMREAELRRAIELPAQRSGLDVEPGLVDVVVRDVRDRAGALPLLSTALAETWVERDDRVLTLAGYRRAGGVHGAVARLAESAYASLSVRQRAAARRLFLRLAQPGSDDVLELRRRLPIREAVPAADPDAVAAYEVLVARRLLIADRETVEVAHEALLREWPRLRAWLDDDVAGRRIHRHLIDAARAWDAEGRDPAELYRGSRLAGALEWSAAHDDDLNDVERAFLRASDDAAQAELDGARAQAAHEAHRSRQLRGLLAGVALLLVVALVAAALARQQERRADGEARTAAANAAEAERNAAEAEAAVVAGDAQRLAAEALAEEDLDRALLLATLGRELDDTVETRGALLQTLLRSPRVLRVTRTPTGARPQNVAAAPDGRHVAVIENDGQVRVLDTQTGGWTAVGGPAPTNRPLGYTAPGDLVLVHTLSADPSDPRADLRIVDPGTGADTRPPLTGLTFFPQELAVSADGSTVAVTGPIPTAPGRLLAVWDVTRETSDPAAIIGIDDLGPPGPATLALAGDGDTAVVGFPIGVAVVDVPTRAVRPVDGVTPVSISADGLAIATGSELAGASIRVLDAATLEETATLVPSAGDPALSVAFTPDGDRLVAAGAERITVWELEAPRVRELLSGHAGAIRGIAVSPDGRTLWSTGLDRSLVAWDIAGANGVLRRLDGILALPLDDNEFALAPGGRYAVHAYTPGIPTPGSPPRGEIRVFDLQDSAPARAPIAVPGGSAVTSIAFGSDPVLVTGGSDGVLRRWDLRRGRQVAEATVGRLPIVVTAASPDSAYVVAAAGTSDLDASPPRSHLVDGETLDQIAALPGGVTAAAFDGASSRLALSVRRGGVTRFQVLSIPSGERLVDVDGIVARSIAWSPDGAEVALGGYDGTLEVRSARDGSLRGPIGPVATVSDGWVSSVAWSDDGEYLVSAGTDGLAHLWDVPTLRRIAPLTFHAGERTLIARFLPGSHELRVATQDGATFAFDVDPDAWSAHACAVAGRDLTTDEWAEVLPDATMSRVCPPHAVDPSATA